MFKKLINRIRFKIVNKSYYFKWGELEFPLILFTLMVTRADILGIAEDKVYPWTIRFGILFRLSITLPIAVNTNLTNNYSEKDYGIEILPLAFHINRYLTIFYGEFLRNKHIGFHFISREGKHTPICTDALKNKLLSNKYINTANEKVEIDVIHLVMYWYTRKLFNVFNLKSKTDAYRIVLYISNKEDRIFFYIPKKVMETKDTTAIVNYILTELKFDYGITVM